MKIINPAAEDVAKAAILGFTCLALTLEDWPLIAPDELIADRLLELLEEIAEACAKRNIKPGSVYTPYRRLLDSQRLPQLLAKILGESSTEAVSQAPTKGGAK